MSIKYKMFRPKIRTRHPSHSVLRAKNKTLPLLPFKSVVRLGSITELPDTVSRGGDRIEINTIDAVTNSKDKLLMKQCFTREEVKTADWCRLEDVILDSITNDGFDTYSDETGIQGLSYPFVIKNRFGSRGRGNTKISNREEFAHWLATNNENRYVNYIVEKFHNYAREYRLHVTQDGYFYTCRKMLKRDTADELKWFRNDQNCVWVREDSESGQFDKPVNWDAIVEQCVNACKAVGLDFAAIDLRVQSATNSKGTRRDNPEFIVIETNSAPSFGDVTQQKYIEVIPEILKKKYENQRV